MKRKTHKQKNQKKSNFKAVRVRSKQKMNKINIVNDEDWISTARAH